MAKYFLMLCFVFVLWIRVTSFCSIPLTFPLNRPFEQLILIFTKYLLRVMWFSITRGRFSQNIFWYHASFFIYDVICDAILLYFTNLITSSPVWRTRLDFYEIFIRNEDVQQNQRRTLVRRFFDIMSRSYLWRHLWRYFALFH